MFGFLGEVILGVTCLVLGCGAGYFVWRKNPTWVDEFIAEIRELRDKLDDIVNRIKN